ncbi:MAG: hypothetical protein LBJ89_00545, partial [Holosporales bacterium]|nr:hypothetical protein [Holosporales bacterium]
DGKNYVTRHYNFDGECTLPDAMIPEILRKFTLKLAQGGLWGFVGRDILRHVKQQKPGNPAFA